MRITGGKARGIRLKTPPRKNAQTRPATDRLRESLFSSLGDQIIGSHCLDLFAGTGSYGLEALSRGALFCGFIESDRTALSWLKSEPIAGLKKCPTRAQIGAHGKARSTQKANVFSKDFPTNSLPLRSTIFS